MRATQLELKQTLLKHPDVPKVLEKVVSAALDDEHKNQAVAHKILMDRILAISTFEKQFVNRENYHKCNRQRIQNIGGRGYRTIKTLSFYSAILMDNGEPG